MWEGRGGQVARSGLAAFSCLVGIGVYAWVVHKKYPIPDWLTWRLGLVWAWVLLFEVACVSLGFLVLWRALRLRTLNLLESLLLSKAIGLGAFGFTFYVAGAAGLFRPWFAVALAVAFVASGAFDLSRRLAMERRTWRHRAPGTPLATWFGLGATVFGAGCFLLLLLQTLTPDSINFDATWYHVPIAQDYARAGKLIPFYGDYNRAFAHLTSIVFTWGFLVPGLPTPLKWVACLQLEMAIVVWKAIGVAAAARWMLGGKRVRGLWAAFFLFPGVFVYDQNPGASADHFLGFFALPVLLATGRALPRLDLRWCAVLGVSLGGAVLVKTQAIYLVGASGALLGVRWLQLAGRAALRELARRRGREPAPDVASLFVPTRRQLILAAVVVGGLALLVAAPHFVKNAVFYKNPLYPFAQNLFASFPEHEKSALLFQKLYPNTPHLPKGEGIMRHLTAISLFFRFALEPHYSFTKGVPVMGALFTLLLPAALLVRRSGRIWIGIGAAFVGIVLWAETYTGDRYLQGIITIPAAVTAALIVRTWELGWLARIGLVPLVAFQLVYGADAPFYSGHKRITAAIDLARSGYEGKRKDDQRWRARSEHLKIDRALPQDAVLLVRNYRTTLGIARPVIFDIQSWQAYVFYEPLKTPADLWEHLRSRGITHLVYPENQRPPDTLQAAVLFDAVAREGKKKKYGSLAVVEMPKAAPEGDSPFRVVVQGMPKYTDGLYRVEQLIAYDRDKKNVIFQKPTPEEKLAKDRKNAADLLAKASAVVVGSKKKKSLEGLGDRFVQVERFKEYTVHLLKDGAAPPSIDDAPSGPEGVTDDPPDPDEIDEPTAPDALEEGGEE